MLNVFTSRTPKLVLIMYMVFKMWDLLPITVKEDLPEVNLQNIALGGLILILVYFTYWLWVCPMDRIRGVRQNVQVLFSYLAFFR